MNSYLIDERSKPFKGKILNFCRFGIYPIWLPQKYTYKAILNDDRMASFVMYNGKGEVLIWASLREQFSRSEKSSISRIYPKTFIKKYPQKKLIWSDMLSPYEDKYRYIIQYYWRYNQYNKPFKGKEILALAKNCKARLVSNFTIIIYFLPEYEQWVRENIKVIMER
ncbi:MAG: hypothetical protein AAF518_20520 [Spirochaetota bacterium]